MASYETAPDTEAAAARLPEGGGEDPQAGVGASEARAAAGDAEGSGEEPAGEDLDGVRASLSDPGGDREGGELTLGQIAACDDLTALEAVVDGGKRTFMRVGLALARIRDARLYLKTHTNFDAYCEQRWGWGKSYAHRLISATTAAQAVPIGTDLPPPQTESQMRELRKAGDPEQQASAYQKAVELAGGLPTAKQIAEVVAETNGFAKSLGGRRDGDVDRRDNAREALTSSESVEWYTPEEYTRAASELMGGIDLDPASCTEANNLVKARRFLTREQDGLSAPWHADSVWLNPPYGLTEDNKSSQAVWIARLLQQFEEGVFPQATALVNSATGNAWFQPLWRACLCFPRRIRFVAPASSEEKNQPTQSNVIAYVGPRHQRFVELFSPLGHCVIPGGDGWSVGVGR